MTNGRGTLALDGREKLFAAFGVIGVIVAIVALVIAIGAKNDANPEAETAPTTTGEEAATTGEEAQSGFEALSNGDFEAGLDTWDAVVPDGVEIKPDNKTSSSGNASVRLTADEADVEESVVLVQNTNLLPEAAEGTAYEVTLDAMTEDLSRALPVSVRLNYPNEEYEFFLGGSGDVRSGIPKGTTEDWVEISIPAIAKQRLLSLDVFVVNSGPGELDGTARIDNVRLEQVDGPN